MRSGRSYVDKFGLNPLICLVLLLLFLHPSARAEIWAYLDARGVAHFAAERLDERYELFFRAGQSAESRHAASARGTPNGVPMPYGLPNAASQLNAFFEVSPDYKQVKHHLREASRVHGVDYALLQAVIATESGFDATAVSPRGAIGLMQLMPATAARFGVAGDATVSLESKLAQPGVNIKAGSRYLRYLINRFPGRIELALAAYNAGEGAVQRAGNTIPNFKETQSYVKTVMQLYQLLKPPALLAEKPQAASRTNKIPPGPAAGRTFLVAPL